MKFFIAFLCLAAACSAQQAAGPGGAQTTDDGSVSAKIAASLKPVANAIGSISIPVGPTTVKGKAFVTLQGLLLALSQDVTNGKTGADQLALDALYDLPDILSNLKVGDKAETRSAIDAAQRANADALRTVQYAQAAAATNAALASASQAAQGLVNQLVQAISGVTNVVTGLASTTVPGVVNDILGAIFAALNSILKVSQ